MSNRLIVACGVVTAMLFTSPDAHAHVVHIDWKITDANLVVTAYFDNDLPADDTEVTLYGSDNTVVATGRTDDNGTWKGSKPPPGNYRLSIKAMANHSQTILIDIAHPPKTVDPQAAGGWIVATVVVLGVALFGATALAWRRNRRRPVTDQSITPN